MDTPSFETIFDPWVLLVLQLANSGEDRPFYVRIREALQDVVHGGHGGTTGGPQDFPLPVLKIRELRRRSVLVADEPELPEREGYIHGLDRWVIEGQDATLRKIEPQLLAVVMVLAKDPRARHLRRCDWAACGKFFFARADHRREHSFCSDEHRRSYDLAHRDKSEMAEYMRRYRATRARRRKTGRRKK